MGHKFEPVNSGKLDNPQRRIILPPEETLKTLNLTLARQVPIGWQKKI